MSIIAIIISVIALIKVGNSSSLIVTLQKRITALESEKGDKNILGLGVVGVDHSSQTEPVLAKQIPLNVQTVTTHQESSFMTWLKEDWLLKLGGVLIIMGVLFFLSLAYVAVGPQGKIVMGYLFGAGLMISGFIYAKRQIIGGSAIHLIGAIVIIITTYLAIQPGYDLFDPYFAMLLMFFTTVCIALTSYAYRRAPLAHVGLVMASIVPLLVGVGQGNFTEILIYLGVVTFGVLWLTFITSWRTLILLSLTTLIGYSLLFIGGSLGSSVVTPAQALLVTCFGLIFFLTSLFSILRSRGVTGKVDGIVALLNAGFALVWIITKCPEELSSIVTALIGCVYALGFFLVYKITNKYTSFLVYGAVALGMLTTALMFELDGNAAVTALILIGAAATMFTYYLSCDEDVTKVISLFNIFPAYYVGVSVGLIGNIIFSWEDVFIVFLAMSMYYLMYFYFNRKTKDLKYIALWAGNLVAIVFLWQVAHLIFGGGLATVISITLYTVIGLFALFQATQENNLTKSKLARIWLGLVAARVIFWDAWQVGDVTLGVFICIVIGILLLSSAFIIKKVSSPKI